MNICKLCKKPKELQESHIIPKFVFRWMKNTGGKYFRTILTPNIRQQDGIKTKLLCRECENKISKFEKWFSESVFIPYLTTNNRIFPYGDLLGKFSISLLWRILINEGENGEQYKDEIEEALEDWRRFLDEEDYVLKFNNIHLVFIPEEWGLESQPNEYISRYFGRVSDGGILKFEDCCIVFSKIARFFFFAELSKSSVNFRGTEISFTNGVTMPGQMIVNEKISLYFIDRAAQVYNHLKSRLSDNQQNQINKEILNNANKLLTSELGKVLKNDILAKVQHTGLTHVFSYVCDCCGMALEEPNGYILRTFEIIKSVKYWKRLFNIHQLGIDKVGLNARIELFKYTCSHHSPWVICEDCINLFETDIKEGSLLMVTWIEQKGDYLPPKSDDFRKYLTQEELKNISYMVVTVE